MTATITTLDPDKYLADALKRMTPEPIPADHNEHIHAYRFAQAMSTFPWMVDVLDDQDMIDQIIADTPLDAEVIDLVSHMIGAHNLEVLAENERTNDANL